MLDWLVDRLSGVRISAGLPEWLKLPQVQEGNPEVMQRLDEWVQPMRRRARAVGFVVGILLVALGVTIRLVWVG